MSNHPVTPPNEISEILHILFQHGHSAWCVGGCVRDSLLGRSPWDWDITTSAKPGTVKSLFPHVIETGIRHGTVTVIHNGVNCEVTTYRTEHGYKDSRHPDKVEFTDHIDRDLARRDFTINAIVWNPQKGLYDPFGGVADLNSRIIRTVGDPGCRFSEDALRMLRGIRFSAQLSFELQADTAAQIGTHSHLMRYISYERIQSEFNKILTSDNPGHIQYLQSLGLLEHILGVPSLSSHTLKSLAAVSAFTDISNTDILPLRLAAVLKGIQGEVDIGLLLSRMKYSKQMTDRVSLLVKYSALPIDGNIKSIRKLSHKVGRSNMPLLFLLKEARLTGTDVERSHSLFTELSAAKNLFNQARGEVECTSIHDLALTGGDLVRLGLKGPDIGRIQRRLYDHVIENPYDNTKNGLTQLAGAMIKEMIKE